MQITYSPASLFSVISMACLTTALALFGGCGGSEPVVIRDSFEENEGLDSMEPALDAGDSLGGGDVEPEVDITTKLSEYEGTIENAQLKQIVIEAAEEESVDVDDETILALYEEICKTAENPDATPFERVVAFALLGSIRNADDATEEQKEKRDSLVPLYWEEGNPIEMRMYALTVDESLNDDMTAEQENAFYLDAMTNCKLVYTRANAIRGGDPKSSPELVAKLVELATNPKRGGWNIACDEIEELPKLAGEAVPKLIAVFDEIPFDQQFRAIRVVGFVEYDPQVTVPFLKKVLADETEYHGDGALRAWSQIAVRNDLDVAEIITFAKQGIVDGWIDDPSFITKELGAKGGPLAEPIIAWLQKKELDDYGYKMHAEALANIGPAAAAAAPILIDAIGKTAGYDRKEYIGFLANIGAGGKQFAPIAKPLLAEDDAREEVLMALAKMGADVVELMPDILPHMDSDDSAESQAAMMAISKMGKAGQAASTQLKAIADDSEDDWRRHYAALALLRLHGDKSKVIAYSLAKLNDIDAYDLGRLKEDFPGMFEILKDAAASSSDEAVVPLSNRIAEAEAAT